MSDMNAYLAAMANVKDVAIDPATGRTVGGSGKSLLEKSGVKDFQLPPATQEQIQKSNEIKKKDGEAFIEYFDVYKNILNGNTTKVDEQQITEQPTEKQLPIPPPQPQQKQFVEIEYKENEDDFMASIVNQIKKSRY